MKLLKQLNPDVATEGGAVTESKGINFAALNGFKGDEAVATLETPKPQAKAEENDPKEQGTPETPKPEGAAGEQKPGGEATPSQGKSSESDESIGSFKFKDEAKVGDEEFSWTALSKEITGSELKADTYEDFKNTINDFKEKIKAEGRSETFSEMISKEPVEVQEAYLLAKNGVSLEEISRPAHEADALLSMSNYDLVKKDFELKGFDPEAIDMKMEKLAESGDIDKLATPIRKSVEEFKASVLNDRAEFINNLRAQEQNRSIQEKQKLSSDLQAELKKAADFLGTPLSDMHRDGIVKRFNEGRYDNLRNSPQALMQAILFTEFGEHGVAALKQRERAAAIEAHTKGLHNTPPVQQGMNTTQRAGDQGKKDNWSALGDFLPK